MKHTFSVIIPTYNRARCVKILLDQLIDQYEGPEEIIIVDDHSSDSTADFVKLYASKHKSIFYYINEGAYQRDAKRTGLKYAHGNFIGFMDDDAQINDRNFFLMLRNTVRQDTVVQAKVILENLGKKDEANITWKDKIATKPFPVLELLAANFNTGSKPRRIFPLIEFGNFWPKSLQPLFIDDSLIKDAYGESYAAALKLYRRNIKIMHVPQLVIRHPGSTTGGSNRFDKKNMLNGFTEFHYGYFYNMVYLHSRFFPGWIWLWLPFFLCKASIALAINHNIAGFYKNAVIPIGKSLKQNYLHRCYV